MGNIATTEIQTFLDALGERYTRPATLYLLGGSALCLLGNPRRTIDIDYTFIAPSSDIEQLTATIDAIAEELRLDLDVVPIEEFIPLPDGSEQRHRWVGQFGQVAVYIYDPYSIALSKLSRGFEADLQDVLFLLRQKIITLPELSQFVESTLPKAKEFDINSSELRLYFNEVRRLLQGAEE